MSSWSFLTNHGLVLTYIGRYPDSTGLEIAQAVGITERAARKIVAELLAGGYIELEKIGRRNRYHLNADLPLRHPAERTATVGELLSLLWREEGGRAVSEVRPPTRVDEPVAGQTDSRGNPDKVTRRRLHPRETPRETRRSIRL